MCRLTDLAALHSRLDFFLRTELWHLNDIFAWAIVIEELMRWMLTIWSCWGMKLCYYDYSQYLNYYKEVKRTALIWDHFQLNMVY